MTYSREFQSPITRKRWSGTGAGKAWQLVSGRAASPLCELGWKPLGVLELTALPSIDEGVWVPMVREIDALLVGGGDPLYLCYWMRQSGLADLLPLLRETVYVGVSAGSLVMAPNVGAEGIVTPSGVIVVNYERAGAITTGSL